MAELFDSLADRARYVHFSQYLIAFCSRPEAASDVIYGASVVLVGADVPIEFSNSMLNGSRDIRVAVFVTNERANEHDRGLWHKA